VLPRTLQKLWIFFLDVLPTIESLNLKEIKFTGFHDLTRTTPYCSNQVILAEHEPVTVTNELLLFIKTSYPTLEKLVIRNCRLDEDQDSITYISQNLKSLGLLDCR
jgi:hypothetical protein